MSNVLVTGSLAYDHIMNFDGRFKDHILPDKVHMLNVSFTAKNLSKNLGGTAGNIAYNLKLLEENPVILGSAGSDFDEYSKWLRENKIEDKYIKIHNDQYTSSAHIITDLDDNQITSFHGGAMLCSKDSIQEELSEIKPELAILAPNCTEGMILHGQELKDANISYIFDPGQIIITFEKEDLINLFKNSKAAIFNDYEFKVFSDRTNIDIDKAKRMVDYLIITLGAKGSLIYCDGKKYKIDIAKPNKVVDPTGAGDAYRAGIIKGLLNSWDVEKMGQWAATASSFAVETYGTQTHTFTIEEFEKRLKINFK